MKRFITFGDFSAVLFAGENRAMLTIYELSLPASVADYIDNAGDISVTEIIRTDDAAHIRMVHSLPPYDVLELVCEALSVVYDADSSVASARPGVSVHDALGICGDE